MILTVWVGGMAWPNTSTTHYHAQLGLPDRCHAIVMVVLCNSVFFSALESHKQSGPTLLSPESFE